MICVLKTLKNSTKRTRDGCDESFRIRIHRAISWVKKARALPEEDIDLKFISLWIAFNCAYGKEISTDGYFGEKVGFRDFLTVICDLDEEKTLDKILWKRFSQSIKALLENKYTYQPYWNYYNSGDRDADWELTFKSYNSKALKALMTQNTAMVLNIVFDRLIPSEISSSMVVLPVTVKLISMQLHDGCEILSELMPSVLDIMLKHHDRDWGRAFYPYVKRRLNGAFPKFT